MYPLRIVQMGNSFISRVEFFSERGCVETVSPLSNMTETPERTICNIYIFIIHFHATALGEAVILAVLHFSMKNIKTSCDISRAFMRSDVNVNQ